MKKVRACSLIVQVPSQLLREIESGKSITEQFPKPKIIQFLNIGDNSFITDSAVHIDQPIFQPIPHVIQFTNYEALQIKEQILKLRNKDKVMRSVKIIPPDSKLFQVFPCKKSQSKHPGSQEESMIPIKPSDTENQASKVAPGMEISYIIRFSPEAKVDYSYDLMVVTEREKFVVPIRAVGCRAMIDFPDQLDFGLVPVKYTAEKPVMIRNIGEKTTKWHIKVPNGFSISKPEGILEVGQQEQLVFKFNPQESRPYRDEIVLHYDQLEAAIPIFGESHNDNVYLSKTHIHMEPTSITLYSHQYYQIVNKSSVPVDFSWRAFATEREENEKKMRLNMQLSQEEAEERMILEESNLEESMAESLDSDDSYDEDELNKKQERAQQKAITTLARKYQSIRKAVEEDLMLFQDDIFSIEPIQGKIWPNTEITCCVTFKPQGPYHYSCTAFCNITCSEERLPLNMTGQGKGPQAQLSITEMDIGDIFVNFQNEFDVGIENTGEIDCHYKLIPYETPFGSKFHFSKTEGILGVKEKSRELIHVTFKSDILGEFSETFRFALEGSSEMLTLTFKGHVVAPTFKFSEEIIDFGKVSYKFPVYKTVHLTNTSDVVINYVVRVPGDGQKLQHEFNITNDRGQLEKNKEATITIEFIPYYPQQYDMVLVVDLEGVGQDMLAVPIKAECLVPKVRVVPSDFLEYDTCFLRHPVTKKIEIINEDSLKAKYEIVPQDDQSKRIAVYSADQESAIINPKSSQVVNITLKTEILSTIRIPLYIKVEGYSIPFMVTILATSIGPIVSVNKSELDYGNVDVLRDYTERITIMNESKIPAEYTAFTKNKESIWKVIQRHGVLKPGDEKEIEVVCNADEVQKFSDTLHIIVNNGVDLEVALRAKGIGSTLYCKDNLNLVDFGVEYTHNNVTKEFFLENRGRKQMKIQWVRTTKIDRKNQKNKPKEDSKGQESPSKKTGNMDQSLVSGAQGEQKEEEIKFVFAVVPDVIVLNPKMGIPIQFRANSFNVGKIQETWACNVTVGGDRKPKTVYNTTVQGEFITPGLQFSEPKLFFKYLWEKGVASMPITKSLDITNGGPLPTSINLKIDPPFSCATEKLTLAPSKTEMIKIDFDPGMKQDRLSDNISGKLNITHVGHPQKDLVHLQGEVCFPNLQIQPPSIDFGCILNDTSKKKYLTLTNISEMAVNYEWSFLEEEVTSLNAVKQEEEKSKKKGKSKKQKVLPINEVFDILPVSGVLMPGQTETVEFTYYSGHGLTYNGIAVCSVDGGPDYEVPIIGDSSFVSYKLSANDLDYGEIPYNESSSKEFFIENVGKVPFEFNINLSTVQRPGVVECHPMTGKVASGERYKVTVKLFPGVPDNINEMFLVECAHFPAERFRVRAIGIYPGCLLSFPRNDDEDFQKRYEETKKYILKGKISYSALFNSQEAMKHMPSIPVKASDKDKSLVKEPFVMDVEAEVDRRFLCDRILNMIDVAQAKQAMNQTMPVISGGLQINNDKANAATISTQNAQTSQKKPTGKTPVSKKAQPQLKSSAGFGQEDKSTIHPSQQFGGATVSLENITIASYICDFGNVVVGSTKKKSFRLTNVGKIPVTFNFDKKVLTQAGISIEPDKVQKVMPNSSILFNVVYATRKNAKFGKTKYVVPIDVKYGPSYNIEFIANLTIPELAMSTDTLDFGKVCVNTRKTVKIRFENQKEVPCEWWYYYKPDVSTAATVAKEGERFTVQPLNGSLLPGQRQTIDVMFIPNSDKPFIQKLTFKCKDNNKQFVLNVKGQGINYQVDLIPEIVNLGPVLPYNTSAIKMIEVRNPMDQAIELYSLDFDKQYLEEEEILKRLDNFSQQQPEPIFLPLRQPGGEFWPSIKKQDEKKRRIEDLKKKIKAIDEQLQAMTKDEANQSEQQINIEQNTEKKQQLNDQKEQLETKLVEEESEALEVKYPVAVKEHNKLNIVLIGPEKCGKTTVANYLASEHQRCVIRLDQLFDYCKQRGLPIADKAQTYLNEKEEELKKLIEEHEKKKKQKKPKKGEEEPEINHHEFKYLPKQMVIEMIQERLKEEDCNAGAIFDCLESINWPHLKFAVECICEAMPKQNIQLLVFQFQKEQLPNDQTEYDVCTNYRYMRRKEEQQNQALKEKEDKTQNMIDSQDQKKTKKKAPQVKQLKKKKEEVKEEPKKSEEEELMEKKIKEMQERKRLEEEKKELLRPKDYTVEEIQQYQKLVEEISNEFAAILMRQMNLEDSQLIEENEANQVEQLPSEDPDQQQPSQPKEQYGKRIMVDQFIHYDFKFLCESAKKQVPEPLWPDPDKEPLPLPVIHQIVKRPPNRNERQPVTLFSIWTPKEEQHIIEDENQPPKLPEMTNTHSRWIINSKETKHLYIKFFSKNIGTFTQNLQFEIIGSYKPFTLQLNAVCEFPMINSNPKNVFMLQKKNRPAQAPECYLQKCFVVQENVFDFGPLLISKDPEKRHTDEQIKKVNSSIFQITNNGKYDLHATFTLKSTLPAEEGGTGEKSPFILDPDQMELKIDETKNLTVYAFPDKAQVFKDEVICLIKDNPNPVIFNVSCLGAKPVVEVDQDIVEFDRLLLEKSLTKALTLKNVCAIPVKWKLNGVAELPEEFIVSKTNGIIKPSKDETIDITFNAKKEIKYAPKITLEVEDTEGFGIKQENKIIEIKAEAFKISLDIRMSHDQILDFDAVRVGEPKENKIYIKNIGMYPVKYNFVMKKKLTREIFTIDPMEGELNPNEEKNVVVRFMSQKEIKLKTEKKTSDIFLNVLEGKSQEKHTEIPINVNVNAVFSKYTITPLKNINFGPMQYGEQVTRTFEIRNQGQFDFKFALCDFKDDETKNKIKAERQKEMEERIKGHEDEKEEQKNVKGKKPEPQKAPPKGKDKGKEVVPEGGVVEVSQYTITPAQGSITPNNAAIVSVTFKAKGAKYYESTLAIDIANRDPQDQPEGIPFEISAESCIPGINTEDLDQIFEEQTVIPTLDPSLNTQTVITSSLFAMQERVFWFGTMIAGKNVEPAKEKFKIINPNKIPCTVKIMTKARTQSKNEGFAFVAKPDTLTIEPHKHKYVEVQFTPTNMQMYGGIFEAEVVNGDPTSKTGKLIFELRGEGTLPTLQIEKPKDQEPDGTPVLKFKKTRVGKEQIMTLVLKNEGSIAATARFDVIKNECFNYMGNMTHTITPKTYQGFDIMFVPKGPQIEKFLLTFNTVNNPFENHKLMIVGEGYIENINFENLPENLEDELIIGDCIVNKAKSATFQINNNSDKTVRFRWNQGDKDEFKFYPGVGHIKAKSSKQVKVVFKSAKTVKYDKIDLVCETVCIEQRPDPETGTKIYRDWDDTMKTMRMVRPSEYRKIMKQREDEERKRKEEAEAALLAAQKKGGAKGGAPQKAAAKKDDAQEEELKIDYSEEATVELIETIGEVEYDKVDGTDKNVVLKTSLVCDYARYECQVKNIDFKPTLMYASRSFKFTIKNTSLISLNYNFKIVNSETGILDAGPYSIIPKKGSIATGCDDHFLVKFSPVEVENDFQRILSANIEHLAPELQPLIIEVNGIAERPVIHFELPPSSYRERKEKDMTPIDSKYKIIEFESLGTNIKNTKRFMAVNPTSSGYEFEWEEVPDENKKLKPMFKCITPKGVILSGKKFEMVFEYIPDNVGEHESYWRFRVSTEKIIQDFMVVGRVVEPNVLFETGKIKFGPLLVDGKSRETVKLINQEPIPFSFNFSKESVKGSPDYGDSLRVNPMSGVIPAQSSIPIEVLFQPKYELTYNYNLMCNVKRKVRPLVLNVKGEGNRIHHSVFADINKVTVQATEPYRFDFGDFFINEKKSKTVYVQNNGEFNFDFVWKRQVNKYITITPETGTVSKGSEVSFEILYFPIAEHQLKNYKVSLSIVSGPKYDFLLNGKARKPGVKLSFNQYDFGPCFMMRQPMPNKAILEITNMDNSAISIETNFEKKPYLDVQLSPGQVLMPYSQNQEKLEVPIIFTPREIKKYQETITMDFNNLYKIDIVITGEGIPMQLELQDPDSAFVNFGIVAVNGDITKSIPLINRSKKPVSFSLVAGDEEQFKKCAITFTPDKEVTLKPKEIIPIEVRYNPKTRMPNFNLDLQVQIKDNEARKLIEVQGVSHGIELKLMDEVLVFGSVVKGSRLTKTLQISNFGDIKCEFKWDSSVYKRNFTISPESGYINPNSNLDLEVTFHPQQVDPDIRNEKIKCEIKHGEPLLLTLMGKCIDQDPSGQQILNFQSVVRKFARQTVNIVNTEDREWVINPTISTELDSCSGYFVGKQTLVVPPKGQAQYEVVYNPKTMTKKINEQMETHKGSLFFPLPNGTALLYKLAGTATEPEAEGITQDTVLAKKAKFIIIPVKNWLKQPQRFKVSWVVEGNEDQTTFVRGANTIDVGGDSEKNYKLSFLAYKVGVYKFNITFKNEQSGEYMFYKMQVQATDPDYMDRIELISPIRESVTRIVTVENPTDTEVSILKSQFVFQNEYIDVNPDTIKIPAKSERGFEICYRPLIVKDDEIDFTLKNPQLGDFKYRLILKALPPSTQKSMQFKCALGADQEQAFKFIHFLKKQTNYSVKIEKVDSPGLSVDFKALVAQVPAPLADNPKGIELSVSIKYEPQTIGQSRAILKLNSPEGMEYTCLLFGKAQAPQPQGPVKCVPGAKPTEIEFKNPLNEKCEFSIAFDNPNFSLASKLPGPLEPGKPTKLAIKYDAKPDFPNTGRMIIQTKQLPPWIYYLQGEQ